MKTQMIILLAVLTAVLATCPADWQSYGDKCFFFSRENETFADALKLCEMIGSQYRRVASLATIDDAGTQKFLANFMRSTGFRAFYFGATDIVHEGTWVWVSTGKVFTYTNWGPQQPNNRGGDENCAVLRDSADQVFHMQWGDSPCTTKINYICEMAYQLKPSTMKTQIIIFLAVLTVVLATCPTDWQPYGDKCFFFSRENETFANALKLCEMIGSQYGRVASLATIDDAGTQKFLANFMRSTGVRAFYFGATDIVHEGTWVWVSTGKVFTYTNWGPQQPNNRGGDENCAVLRDSADQVFHMQWGDSPCTTEINYICEMAVAEIHSPIVG
uniref:Macrophage mannose receptor 1-like n=1 Tax=Crassostrea virginica TaxID=6565 RepID=A0A8B8BS57_CRAVI|nr:macrophage mannose receptor 1-like [Crassostrea virginica]